MLLSRRDVCRHIMGLATLAGLAGCPLAIDLRSGKVVLAENAARAQGNGGGGNGGGGNGNGGGGNGNAGGGGTGGQGGHGGNGNRGGQGDAATAGKGNSAGKGRGFTRGNTHPSRRAGHAAEVSILHSNGMREAIRNGVYEMLDARGRIVISRPATIVDHARMRSMP